VILEQIKKIQGIINEINGKWDVVVINILMHGERHFNEILRSIDGITPKALSGTLKKLIASNIIEKNVKSTNPVNIIYSLTEKGMALTSPINSLLEWKNQCDKKK